MTEPAEPAESDVDPSEVELSAALEQVLRRQLDQPGLRVSDLVPITAGASRGMWSLQAHTATGVLDLVLRRGEPGVPDDGTMAREVALMRAAGEAGVPSPGIVASGTGDDELAAAYVVMERVQGETLPQRILRDEAYADLRPRLARECGKILARLHRIPIDTVPDLDDTDQLQAWRAQYDSYDQPSPTFEVALAWLERHRPVPRTPTVVHGDFRNGNLMIGPDGVRAVLDWELAHVGDPAEDLGWLCAPPWRFRSPHPVGGFGATADLLAGYRDAGGVAIAEDELHWWTVFATFRWGVLCLYQADRHRRGTPRSVELALVGRRVAEVEWDLLQLL